MPAKKKSAAADTPEGLPVPLLAGGGLLLAVLMVLTMSMQGAPVDQVDDTAAAPEVSLVPVALTVDDPPQLAKVFKGKEPWLVWCSDSMAAGPDGTAPLDIVEAVAAAGTGVSVGTLDCSASLPSKKTTYTKLGLDKAMAPVMFVSANNKKANQVPVEKITIRALVAISKKAATPILLKPHTDDEFRQLCWYKEWCALIATHGTLDNGTKAEIDVLMRQFPKVKFATIDVTKYALKTQPKVLKKGEPAPRANTPVMIVWEKRTQPEGKFSVIAHPYREANFSSPAGSAAAMISKAIGGKAENDRSHVAIQMTENPELIYKNEKKDAAREERKAKRAQEVGPAKPLCAHVLFVDRFFLTPAFV